jgi:hypothetical protein
MVKSIHLNGRFMGDIMAVHRILEQSGEFDLTYEYPKFKSKAKPREVDVLVWSHRFPSKIKAKHIIHTGHGYGFFPTIILNKKQFLEDVNVRGSTILFYGEKHRAPHLEMGHLKEKTHIVGMPFSALLMQEIDEVERREFHLSKKLDPNKKTVLYSPTWDRGVQRGFFAEWWQDGKEEDRVREFVDFITIKMGVNLIIRMHESKRYAKNWLNVYRKYFDHPNVYAIYFEQDYNNLPYYQHSDILVGDWSGVNTYFYITDKPVIHVGRNAYLKKQVGGYGSMDINMRPRPIVDTFDQLLENIENSLANPSEFSKDRQRLVETYIDYTGEESKKRVLGLFAGLS